MSARRRVVIGTDALGKSVVFADEPLNGQQLAPRGHELTMLWGQDAAGSLPTGAAEPLVEPFLPAVGGWRVSVLTIEPDAAPLLAEGAGTVLPDLAAAMQRGGGRGMHATDTVDVVVVLSGELDVEIDNESAVHLNAGDWLVQLGGRHAWRNPTNTAASIAVFMAGAQR